MKARERWHCTNNECGCQVVVEIGGDSKDQSPLLATAMTLPIELTQIFRTFRRHSRPKPRADPAHHGYRPQDASPRRSANRCSRTPALSARRRGPRMRAGLTRTALVSVTRPSVTKFA